uniref:Uncharacterized protein n=1 Tax=Electrophorus electricus TaxID=8005 RepID=A0A4W4G4S8_ELEEL
VALLMDATLPSTGSGLVAVHVLHGRKLLGAHGALVLLVGVRPVDVGEQGTLIAKDLGAVDALQLRSVRELRMARQNMLLQLVRLAEGLLAVVAHVQVLVLAPGHRHHLQCETRAELKC